MDIDLKRNSVISLFLAGKRNCEIIRSLKHLKLTKYFVSRTIKRYKETGSVEKRYGGGRRPTATISENVKKIRSRLEREPRRSARKLATDLQISDRSVRRILKDKLGVKPYKIQKVQELTIERKKVRLERCKALKQRLESGQLNNLVFSDEKIFTIQQCVNKQNDRVWLPKKSAINMTHLRAYRKQGAASVMVWAGITATGRTPLIFVPQNVKMSAKVYIELILEGCLKPWAKKHFKSQSFVFQQDSAPSHKAKVTQDWLEKNVPSFITPSEWPPYSPDLNPMDFAIWGILESKLSTKTYSSLESLKKALQREWNKIPQYQLRASVDAFHQRIKDVIRCKGD